MTQVLRLAIVDPKDTTRDALKSLLLGMDRIWLEAEASRYEFFADVVSQTHPDVGVISLDADPDKGLDLVSQLHKTSPECSILVVSSSSDGSLILRAMRAGAKEFLTHPIKLEDLLTALDRITTLRFGKGTGKSRGCTTIAVAGSTGGVGTTSLAVNLGCALAADEKNTVVLVDLDMCLGDADVFLDAIPEYTVLDLAQNVTRLDFALLKRSLTKHSSGLFLLPRPVHLEDIPQITEDDMQRVFGLLKATFTHMIIDLSKSYSRLDMLAMQVSDHVLLVTQLDLPCLRNVVRLNTSLNEHSAIKDKVKIVVNRVGLESGQITLKKAQETLGKEIFSQLPNDYRTMSEVRNNGVPLVEQAPRAAITQAVLKLAAELCDDPELAGNADKGGKGKWFGLWSSKTKA
ncbi:MAG: pilus assembly protein CpaE [Planctomycetota bacterium]|nr:MAG: pilus assembly protein CpaE [Planctomycetota bacterium]